MPAQPAIRVFIKILYSLILLALVSSGLSESLISLANINLQQSQHRMVTLAVEQGKRKGRPLMLLSIIHNGRRHMISYFIDIKGTVASARRKATWTMA